MLATGLGTLVTYNPWSISPSTGLGEIVRTFDGMGFHHLPVVDEGQRLLGIISEQDVVRAVEALRSASLSPHSALHMNEESCQAENIMTRQLVVLGEEQSPREALELMLANNIHSLLVVEQERLVGVVTSSDYLREFSYGGAAGSRMSVADALRKASETIELDASLDEAKLALDLAGTNHLAVVRDDFPLGVISRRDVHKARYRHTVRELLGEIVTAGPSSVRELIHGAPTISPGRRLGDVAAIMVECRVQAVAVVNQANRLLGIVTEEAILHTMLPGLDK